MGEEPYLPETIYQRLDYLDSYALFEREGESYDDLSEDEEQLDLTAPPPESWVTQHWNNMICETSSQFIIFVYIYNGLF